MDWIWERRAGAPQQRRAPGAPISNPYFIQARAQSNPCIIDILLVLVLASVLVCQWYRYWYIIGIGIGIGTKAVVAQIDPWSPAYCSPNSL